MSTSAIPAPHPVFLKQVEALGRQDLDALMDLYHPEAEWIRFQGVIRGRAAIRELISRYWELNLEFVEMNEYVHTDDVIMTRSTMAVQGEPLVTFGIYVLKDGLFWRITGADEGGARDWWPEDGRPAAAEEPAGAAGDAPDLAGQTSAGLLARTMEMTSARGREAQYHREARWLAGPQPA
jgi:hypothetical protein